LTDHPRESIIRFHAFAPDTVVRLLDAFVNDGTGACAAKNDTSDDTNPKDKGPLYTPVRKRTHLKTTMRNLERGVASWDAAAGRSRSATYEYDDID